MTPATQRRIARLHESRVGYDPEGEKTIAEALETLRWYRTAEQEHPDDPAAYSGPALTSAELRTARRADRDALTFTHVAGDDDQTDDEWRCDQFSDWSIQDARSYGSGYCVAQHAPEDTPDADYWVAHFGSHKDLDDAKAEVGRRVAAIRGAAQ
ncbi:MAG: hypothetical protein V4659_04115 [Pseudomonadota bacterium]